MLHQIFAIWIAILMVNTIPPPKPSLKEQCRVGVGGTTGKGPHPKFMSTQFRPSFGSKGPHPK